MNDMGKISSSSVFVVCGVTIIGKHSIWLRRFVVWLTISWVSSSLWIHNDYNNIINEMILIWNSIIIMMELILVLLLVSLLLSIWSLTSSEFIFVIVIISEKSPFTLYTSSKLHFQTEFDFTYLPTNTHFRLTRNQNLDHTIHPSYS